MTVSSEVSTAGPFFGNGSVKTFPYAFKILDEKHIRVVFISTSGDVSDLSLENGDYTVTGVGNEAGGNVVKATPLLTGQTLTIVRRLPLTQDTSLENQGAYYPEVVEQRFDLLTMQIQSVQETTERSLTVEPGQEKPSMTVIAATEAYAQAAQQSRNEASASATDAMKWASNPEDVPVASGLFSALHWAKKAMVAVTGMLSKAGGTLTGDVLFGPGGTGGSKYSKIQANGDVQLNRGDNTGYITWNFGNSYFGWDGSRYTFGPAGPVAVSGYLQVEVSGVSAKYYETGDHTFAGAMASEFGTGLGAALRTFKSGNQPYVTNGSGSVAHGLGRKPSKLSFYLVCTTAANGWAVGDEIEIGSQLYVSGSSPYGITYWADATNIYWKIAATGLAILNKSTGQAEQASTSNYALRFRGAM